MIMTIGNFVVPRAKFQDLDQIFAAFHSEEFKSLPYRKRFVTVNQTLLNLLLNAQKFAFLLPAVIDFIGRVNSEEILIEKFHISHFEFWLNHFSELSEEENYLIRGKIAGKYIPRDEYQVLFPIGMGKVFDGTHFVAAHLSPDVDTMVASFWGWLDAFAARVGNARHIWSLPGGPPDSPVTHFFYEFFGSEVFTTAANTSGSLTLSAIDLVTGKGYLKKKGDASLSALDFGLGDKAIVLVDSEGFYLGDWHGADVEPIRKIIIRFKSCLRWFENNLHVQLISLFAKTKLHIADLHPFFSSVFDVLIADCEPVKEFSERQKKDLNDFFSKVLGLKDGLNSTFRELNKSLAQLSMYELLRFQETVESLETSGLFDAAGNLREDRPSIFNQLEKIIHQLDHAIHRVRDYAEHLDVALRIKSQVFNVPPQVITTRSDVEDIRIKTKKHEYLTVVIPEGNRLFPIGVVWANLLNQQTLGTVSFRDFCNQEEVRMASYLTPISVIDHHKASLKTLAPPLAIIGDAQSCNVLLAELAFKINDGYSLIGMNEALIEEELKQVLHEEPTYRSMRLLERLNQRRIVAKSRKNHFIHPHREITEYLCFLHAILDDTDLLTKISKRDVDCVVELLNRIQSLIVGKEVELIDLDDIPKDEEYAKIAAKRILRNPEMYSFYKKIYLSKEEEAEKNLRAPMEKFDETLFADTKVQNGCCRVGQTKLFAVNFPTFQQKSALILENWVHKAQSVFQEQSQIDLHMHMISTITSADEVYEEKVGHYKHQDELWFWVPATQKSLDHLASFLTAFQAKQKLGETARIEFFSGVNAEVQEVFIRNATGIPWQKRQGEPHLPVIILHFNAGLINSRKAMVTPYLPRILA